jgi:trk system potassium uptake protein TrkH
MTLLDRPLDSPAQKRLGCAVRVTGLVLAIFGAIMLVPCAVALISDGQAGVAFVRAAIVTSGCGALFWYCTRGRTEELQRSDGFLIVTLNWGLLPAFGGLPLLFFLPGITFTDAYFEGASGLTTTGATILAGLDQLPAAVNLWRGMLQWLGGMGLIVLAVAILPMLGIGGRQIFLAETTGAFKDAALTARVRDTARGLWYIYVAITAACALVYWLAGMSVLDAVIHSFSTLSLGGFSSHDASFGYFDSPLLEAMAIVFMLIAGVNFSTHFLAWRTRSMQVYRADPEAYWFVGVTLTAALLVAAILALSGNYPSVIAALRYSSFNVVSIATTTGYANTDYNVWPIFAPGLMLMLCLFASSAGSTGGGVKMIRVKLALLQLHREFVRLAHPNAAVPVKLGKRVVEAPLMISVFTFLAAYASVIAFLTLALTASGLSLPTAASAIVACISNTGPGLNEVGPATTYAVLTDYQTWICSIAMLIGRLELFTVLVIFTRNYWRR